MFLALFLLIAKVCLYAVVQFLSRIVSHLLLTIVNSCGLYNDGQVSARTDRDIMADHLIAEKLRGAVLQAQPVVQMCIRDSRGSLSTSPDVLPDDIYGSVLHRPSG